MICIVDKCRRKMLAKKLCSTHYSRLIRGMEVHTPIRLSRKRRGCSIKGCVNIHRGHGLCKNHLRNKRLYGDPLKSIHHGPYDGALCKVEECLRRATSRSYCLMHYQNWKRHGNPRYVGERRIPTAGTCNALNCNRPRKNRGYCSTHYSRLLINGDPYIVRKNNNYHNTLKVCSIDGCERKYTAKNMCHIHYHRWRFKQPCIIPGCVRKQKGYGFCRFHREITIPFDTRLRIWQILLYRDNSGFIDRSDTLSAYSLTTKNTSQKAFERLKEVLGKCQINYDIVEGKIKIYMDFELLDWWYKVLTEGKKKRVHRTIYAA